MQKRALITGITGQDGAYLAKLLIDKDYEVFGAYRRSSNPNLSRLQEMGVGTQVKLVPLDLIEFSNILRTLESVKPDEVYNLAAQSFVALSFEQPLYTSDVDALGVARLLEAIRVQNPQAKFYQASTSEMFGKVQETPQSEKTPFYPRSPYGVAKLYAHWMTVNYREAYHIHASSGILFNHESPLRGMEFVTRKVTASLARMRQGESAPMELGNMDAARDWGFAGDYVVGMWQMLQQSAPDDYVLSTGVTHTVKEFVEVAARAADFQLEWSGEGLKLRGIDRRSGRVLVQINPKMYRPAEVEILHGDSTKAKKKLGWIPRVGFEELVGMMVKADMDRASKGLLPLTDYR